VLDTVDITGLSGADHTAFIRFQDSSGNWSDFIQQRFTIPDDPPAENFISITDAEVRFDSTSAASISLSLNSAAGDMIGQVLDTVDITGLSGADHTAFIRFQDSSGNWSDFIQQRFTIPASPPASDFVNLTEAEVFVDTEPGEGLGYAIALNSQGSPYVVIAQGEVDVSVSEPGNHAAYTRFKDSLGNWLSPFRSTFLNFSPGVVPSPQEVIVSADKRIDFGAWQPISAPSDGSFDEGMETAQDEFTVSPGYHNGALRFIASNTGNTPLPAHLANDTDQDGLPDSWELAEFGHLNYDGNDDLDGDGITNAEEFYLGTDPGDFEGGDIPTISGYVLDGQGAGKDGINVCI
ncbi:MAG: hypothetical protein GY703_06520, partial [Gammaproteobacteria bacterium]|nr:hypothetical protein [Gammaproteobacteria bacterium]